ncbi:unnamed protein product, partial [marine sediment metagenome]
AVEATISELATAKEKLETSYGRVLEALGEGEASVAESKEDAALMRTFGEALVEHIHNAHSCIQVISGKASAMSEAEHILKHELDALAGTEDISVLIDLCECWCDIKKKFEIGLIKYVAVVAH